MSPAKPPKRGWQQVPPNNPGKPQGKPQAKPAPPPPKRPAGPAPKIEITSFKTNTEVHFACPACGQPFSMKTKFQGRKAKCSCGARIIVPPPGGIPKATWMPSEEIRKKAQQKWQSSGSDKNPTEIALETGNGTKLLLAGALFSALVGAWWYKNRQDQVVTPVTDGSGLSGGSSSNKPTDIAPGDVAGAIRAGVVGVDALDDKGAVIGSGSGFICAEKCVATSAWLLMGATKVRVRLQDGSLRDVTTVEALDTGADLAVIGFDTQGTKPLVWDETGILDAGQAVWIGASGRPPLTNTPAKPVSGEAARRLTTPLPSSAIGAAVVNAQAQVVGIAVRLPGGVAAIAPPSAVRKLLVDRKPGTVAEKLVLSGRRPAADVAGDADRLMNIGRVATARAFLEAAATESSDSAVLVKLGDTMLALGSPRAAEKHFLQATAKSSPSAAWCGVGRARLCMGETTRALKAFRAAATAQPDNALASAGIAFCLAMEGDATRAAAAAARAASSADRQGLALVAQAYALLKDKSAVARILDSFDATGASEAEKLLLRAEIALCQGDPAGGTKLFADAEVAGAGPRAVIGRSRAISENTSATKAEAASILDPIVATSDEAAALAVVLWEAAEKSDRSQTAIDSLLALAPEHYSTQFLAGTRLLRTDPVKAAPAFELAHRARPDAQEAVLKYATSADRASAEAMLSQFLKTDPSAVEVRVQLASIKAVTVPDDALKLLEGISASGPVAGRIAFVRGTALLNQGKHAEASTQFEIAISNDASNGLYRWNRAIAVESENIHRARGYWEAYIAWGKANKEDPARLAAAEKRMLERFGR